MSPSHSERRDTGGLNIIPNVVIGIRHIIPPKLSTKFLSTKFQGPPPPTRSDRLPNTGRLCVLLPKSIMNSMKVKKERRNHESFACCMKGWLAGENNNELDGLEGRGEHGIGGRIGSFFRSG